MRRTTKKTAYNKIIFFFAFILLTLNISFNLFDISSDRNLYTFEESLTIGRIVKSEKDGLFSAAGFPGIVYDKKSSFADSIINNKELFESHSIRDLLIIHNRENQFIYYLGWEKWDIPNDYYAYTSQTGGNALLYSILNLLLPFDHNVNILLFRLLNGFLLTLCIFLFIGWCKRNYGMISSIIIYILIFFSPWIMYMGGSLWWSVWTYYLPFLTMLLLLEKKHNSPSKVSENKIFFCLFTAVFLKHLLFGFEFVTTILLAIYPPIVYYYWIEKGVSHRLYYSQLKQVLLHYLLYYFKH